VPVRERNPSDVFVCLCGPLRGASLYLKYRLRVCQYAKEAVRLISDVCVCVCLPRRTLVVLGGLSLLVGRPGFVGLASVLLSRWSSGVAPRACVRVYARVLVPLNLYIHTYIQPFFYPGPTTRCHTRLSSMPIAYYSYSLCVVEQ